MFEPQKFKRGLLEIEEPFPVIPKVGPYVVSIFLLILIIEIIID